MEALTHSLTLLYTFVYSAEDGMGGNLQHSSKSRRTHLTRALGKHSSTQFCTSRFSDIQITRFIKLYLISDRGVSQSFVPLLSPSFLFFPSFSLRLRYGFGNYSICVTFRRFFTSVLLAAVVFALEVGVVFNLASDCVGCGWLGGGGGLDVEGREMDIG